MGVGAEKVVGGLALGAVASANRFMPTDRDLADGHGALRKGDLRVRNILGDLPVGAEPDPG